MTIDELLERLKKLTVFGKGFKPHRYIALLTVLQLIRERVIANKNIQFDNIFKDRFGELLKIYGDESDRNRPHNPFFHLSSSGFWKLVPNKGKEELLAEAKTIGSAGDLEFMVSHAELDQTVFDLFAKAETGLQIENTLQMCVTQGMRSRFDSIERVIQTSSTSLFQHEEDAISEIKRRTSVHNLGLVLHNLDIYDPQSNRYFEVDLVLISTFGVYVIELKHWSGRIEIRPHSWLQNNSFFKRDPHRTNNFKAKLIRGLYEHRFPSYPPIYFQSIVILTNPDTSVEGASIPTTTADNPTFEGIERFVQYLINQKELKKQILRIDQCEAFDNYLKKLHSTAPPRDFLFPGYEIIERLCQDEQRAEVIARRTDIRHRRLSRLRIFFPLISGSEVERLRFHERATATLNAVAKTGEHQNILKVWPIPNEDNYIVEGSDWSETGTLRDVLEEESKLSVDRSKIIFAGIMQGLSALHQECVVHRALNPDNILIIDDIPKLMNFDLSFQLEDNRLTVIPDVSKLKRSPYIAPEIYKEGTVPEATADLFSAGVILYEMLTGELPFGSSTDLERSHGQLKAAHLQKLIDAYVPQYLQDLIQKLIQANPAKRIAYATDAIKLLQAKEKRRETEKINAELQPGEESGLYHIDGLLKHGAESQIYKAQGARANNVVIKLFNADVPLQRVVDEQQYAGAIHHSSIVRVDNYSRWEDGRFYVAFHWISERSLWDEIKNGIRPDLKRFQGVALQLLDALAALHNRTEDGELKPILHNDLKPENILLADGDRPVIIDFGSASHPHIGVYEGTEGYVAPDLKLGQDRKYSEDGDLYALGVTLSEWLCGTEKDEIGRDNISAVDLGIIEAVRKWLSKATADEVINRFSSAAEMRNALETALAAQEAEPIKKKGEYAEEEEEKTEREIKPTKPAVLDRVSLRTEDGYHPNPFVAYLNSLHCRSAGSENALAESQMRNPQFSLIHVQHPVTDVIEGLLLEKERRHVILTGHAGDGKSTVAVELYKRFKNIPVGQPLQNDIGQRENLRISGFDVSIIKDFSECSLIDRNELLKEMVKNDGPRFLLITNTGVLLEAFCNYDRIAGEDWVRTESDILTSIDTAETREMYFHGARFSIINLSMTDNLGIAEQIFSRMIAADQWKICKTKDCSDRCPIYCNVELIRQNEVLVKERIFLAYRRLYEYGTKLTLRQLSAHLAYMITAGLNYKDIINLSQKASRPLLVEFMFFNRFFGDNGREIDSPAMQIRAASAIQGQGFGMHPCPTWERRLWMQSKGITFRLNASGCSEEFEQLRRYGARLIDSENLSDEEARKQVRRMLYFLHRFDRNDNGMFVKTFLNSMMIMDFARWQRQTDGELSLKETTGLNRRIFHVLQEHFTGVRLPEGTPTDRSLFITLSRRSSEVRQSAQVVLACIPESEFKLSITSFINCFGGVRRELMLRVSGNNHIMLRLDLPFLDYVMIRNQGEVGKNLQSSYVDRLEKFKAELIRMAGSREDNIMLVRLRTNHTFRRQIYAVRSNKLEVADG